MRNYVTEDSERYAERLQRMTDGQLNAEIKSYYKIARPPLADLAIMEVLMKHFLVPAKQRGN